MKNVDFDDFPELDVNSIDRRDELVEKLNFELMENETIRKFVKVLVHDDQLNEKYEKEEEENVETNEINGKLYTDQIESEGDSDTTLLRAGLYLAFLTYLVCPLIDL